MCVGVLRNWYNLLSACYSILLGVSLLYCSIPIRILIVSVADGTTQYTSLVTNPLSKQPCIANALQCSSLVGHTYCGGKIHPCPTQYVMLMRLYTSLYTLVYYHDNFCSFTSSQRKEFTFLQIFYTLMLLVCFSVASYIKFYNCFSLVPFRTRS